jgi:FimV-like protein
MVDDMIRRLTGLFVALVALYSSAVGALGLGELTLDSYLNEPLKGQVQLLNIGGLNEQQIRIKLVSRDGSNRTTMEREDILASLIFELELDEAGHGVLHVSTDQKLNEPYLNFAIEARWPTGRILREYAVLLEEPLFTGGVDIDISAATTPEAASAVAPQGSRSAPEPQVVPGKATRPAIEVSAPLFANVSSLVDSEYYKVSPEETLWAIASEVKLEGVSLHQTMLVLQKLNPEAFIDGNINQLESGSVLRLPTQGQFTERNFEEAVAVVAAHHQSWQQHLAGTQESDAEKLPQLDDGESDFTGVELEGDQSPNLKIVMIDDQQDEGIEDLSSEVVANLQDLERAQRSNEELRERHNAMDRKIIKFQRSVILKDELISVLNSSDADTPVAVITDLDAETNTLEQDSDQTEFAIAQPALTSSVVPAVVAESHSLTDVPRVNILYMLVFLVIILIGVGYGFYRLKFDGSSKNSEQIQKTAVDEFSGVELGDEKELDLEIEMGDLAAVLESASTEVVGEKEEEFMKDFNFSDMQMEDASSEGSAFEAEKFEQEQTLDRTAELPVLDLPDISDVPGFEGLGGQDIGSYSKSIASGRDSGAVNIPVAEELNEMFKKLDLARAYVDMGDSQGARIIIEEVLEGGSEKQLQEAKKLLERLDG